LRRSCVPPLDLDDEWRRDEEEGQGIAESSQDKQRREQREQEQATTLDEAIAEIDAEMVTWVQVRNVSSSEWIKMTPEKPTAGGSRFETKRPTRGGPGDKNGGGGGEKKLVPRQPIVVNLTVQERK